MRRAAEAYSSYHGFVRFVFFAILLFSPGSTPAQLGPVVHRSLEARIVSSKLVFSGSISAMSRHVLVEKGGLKPDGTKSTAGEVEYSFTVTVEEIIKGNPGETVEIVRETNDYDRRIDQWREAGLKFLWFRKTDTGKPAWESIRLGDSVPADAIYKIDAPPLFSLDFSVLRTQEEILNCARNFVEVNPDVEKFHLLRLVDIPEGIHGSAEGNYLSVPVEDSLEDRARRLIQTPREFVPKGLPLDSLSQRVLREGGVSALVHFQSGENEAILKALLKDPSFRVYHNRPGVKAYPIRKIAYGILQAWGVDCVKPVLMERDGKEIEPE